jgi:hypothetical protein
MNDSRAAHILGTATALVVTQRLWKIVGASRATGRMERHDLLTANSEGVRCPSVVL